MKLHIYNPEHDISLARDTGGTAIPRAALHARRLYGHVPAYWAQDGDMVVVEDTEGALARLEAEGRSHAKVDFVTLGDVGRLSDGELPAEIVPWGWDRGIAGILTGANPLHARLIPSGTRLREIRKMSSRVFAAEEVLPRVLSAVPGLVGRMEVFSGTGRELAELVRERKQLVLKSPWSCSGRGVRFVRGEMTDNDAGWAANVIGKQGCILVEPLYDKALDFSMEFRADEKSGTEYLGLGIFETGPGGAYRKNTVATEEDKLRIVEKHVPPETLLKVRNAVVGTTSRLFRDRYTGPFGVDMMVVRTGETTGVHPCVELNLRYTMGHAALLRDE